MARIIQVTNDGTRTETNVIYMASNLRLAKDRFEHMRALDKEKHKESYEDINPESYIYKEGVMQFTITLLLK